VPGESLAGHPFFLLEGASPWQDWKARSHW